MAREGLFSVNVARRLEKLPTPDLLYLLDIISLTKKCFKIIQRIEQYTLMRIL